MSSAPVSVGDLKSVETPVFGIFTRIPKSVVDTAEEYGMIRLRQGLYVEINLASGAVVFTQRCLDAMQDSENDKVKKFAEQYKKTLTDMAAGTGLNVNPHAVKIETVNDRTFIIQNWLVSSLFTNIFHNRNLAENYK